MVLTLTLFCIVVAVVAAGVVLVAAGVVFVVVYTSRIVVVFAVVSVVRVDRSVAVSRPCLINAVTASTMTSTVIDTILTFSSFNPFLFIYVILRTYVHAGGSCL